MSKRLSITPLQRVLGFDVAEEIYDELPFMAQIIIDLKIEGYTDSDIARCLNMPRTTVVDTFRRARNSVAMQKMKLVLETRVHYMETHRSIADTSIFNQPTIDRGD